MRLTRSLEGFFCFGVSSRRKQNASRKSRGLRIPACVFSVFLNPSPPSLPSPCAPRLPQRWPPAGGWVGVSEDALHSPGRSLDPPSTGRLVHPALSTPRLSHGSAVRAPAVCGRLSAPTVQRRLSHRAGLQLGDGVGSPYSESRVRAAQRRGVRPRPRGQGAAERRGPPPRGCAGSRGGRKGQEDLEGTVRGGAGRRERTFKERLTTVGDRLGKGWRRRGRRAVVQRPRARTACFRAVRRDSGLCPSRAGPGAYHFVLSLLACKMILPVLQSRCES